MKTMRGAKQRSASEPPEDTFGHRLRQRRRALGLTQEQVAEALFCAPSTVSFWELGRHEPDLWALKGLSQGLGVTLDWLVLGDRPGVTAAVLLGTNPAGGP